MTVSLSLFLYRKSYNLKGYSSSIAFIAFITFIA